MANLLEVCRRLGLKKTRIYELVDLGVIIKTGQGAYDLLASMENYIAYLKELLEAHGSKDLQEQRARLIKVQAERNELRLQRERGELLRVEVAQRVWGIIIQNFRRKLLSFSTRLAPQILGIKETGEAQGIVEKLTHEFIVELTSPDLKKISKNLK